MGLVFFCRQDCTSVKSTSNLAHLFLRKTRCLSRYLDMPFSKLKKLLGSFHLPSLIRFCFVCMLVCIYFLPSPSLNFLLFYYFLFLSFLLLANDCRSKIDLVINTHCLTMRTDLFCHRKMALHAFLF